VDKKLANIGKNAPEAFQATPKEKRLEEALRSNLARRKEAQKSRPHRKNLPGGS